MKLFVSIIFEIVVIILFYVRYKSYKIVNPDKKYTGLIYVLIVLFFTMVNILLFKIIN